MCKRDILHDYTTLKPHMRFNHKMSVREYYENYIIGDCVPDNETQNKWGKQKLEILLSNWTKNLCAQCQLCLKQLDCQHSLKLHLHKEHKIKFKEYSNVYKQVRMYHTCRICSSQITHTRLNIAQHVKNSHQIEVNNYFTAHILPDLLLRQSHGFHKMELVKV